MKMKNRSMSGTSLSLRDLQCDVQSLIDIPDVYQPSKQSQQRISMSASCSSSLLTVTPPTTLIGSSSLKNPFPARSKNDQ